MKKILMAMLALPFLVFGSCAPETTTSGMMPYKKGFENLSSVTIFGTGTEKAEELYLNLLDDIGELQKKYSSSWTVTFSGKSLEELRQFASVLYETAQPSPEITLFLLDNRTVERLQETAGDLYDAMQAVEKKYRISCGLESVLSQSDQAALPCWSMSTASGYALLHPLAL